MMDLFALGPWGWIIAGVVLVGVEVLAPGAFMLWLGLAALATGLIAFLVPLGLESGSLVFAGLAIASVLVGRALTGRQVPPVGPQLNDRGSTLVGRVFVLDGPLSEGRGRVRVDDGFWQVTGPDLPAGTEVRVTGSDGSMLQVVAA